MSFSEKELKMTKKIIYFHGQDVNSAKSQQKTYRKNSLISVILANAAIIIGLTLTIAIFALLGG